MKESKLDDDRREAAEQFFMDSQDLGFVEDSDGWERVTNDDSISRVLYIDNGSGDLEKRLLTVHFKPKSAKIDHILLDGEDVPH